MIDWFALRYLRFEEIIILAESEVLSLSYILMFSLKSGTYKNTSPSKQKHNSDKLQLRKISVKIATIPNTIMHSL